MAGIATRSFALFVLAGLGVGVLGAASQFYRFAAAEAVPVERRGQAISLTLAGGVLAAFLGPIIARHTRDLATTPFAASFAVLVGVAGVTIGTMPLYGNDSYGLLLVFALIGGVGYITIDLLMNGVIADVFPEKKSTLLPIVHGFYGLGAMLAPLLVTWLTDSGRPATFAVPYLVLGAAALVLGAVFWAVWPEVSGEGRGGVWRPSSGPLGPFLEQIRERQHEAKIQDSISIY
jgi:MFS family permease